MTDDDAIERGADALESAFPTLCEDFTRAWFEKVTRIVLEAVDTDTIKSGDQVSWQFPGYARHFGVVKQVGGDSYYVSSNLDAHTCVISAEFITKEVG